MTDVWVDGSLKSHYDYNSNGNRVGGTYDDQDRMIKYGENTYSYSANGELQQKVTPMGTTKYEYDVLGNLTAVTLEDGTKIEYVIDGANRRVGKKVNGVLVQGWLYQDGLKPVAELDGNGNVTARFVYGTSAVVPDYMVKNGTTYRIIRDHLGSPRMIVRAETGQVVERIDYDEFGNVVNDTNPGFTPFSYAGGLYDKDTKLTRFGARDYDAESGRWTSKDQIVFEEGNYNVYQYCLGDVINYTDQTGRLEKPVKFMSCDELLKAIIQARDELVKRYMEMRADDNGLYPNNVGPDGTTWKGHQDQYNGVQNRLRKLLDQFNKGPCSPNALPQDVWRWATLPPPTKPALKLNINYENAAKYGTLGVAGFALYIIISEGSRIVFPPRNFIPVL